MIVLIIPYFTHPLNGTVATDVPFNISINGSVGKSDR